MNQLRISSDIEQAIRDYKAGKVIIVTDSENRENEGDFCCSAQTCTPEIVNFMITQGKGLLCLAVNNDIAERLNLRSQVNSTGDPFYTNFSQSIDAKKGLTTGISALERNTTVMEVIRGDSTIHDFVSPGHLFPLIAKKNGIFDRPGHTEATVDLSVISGHAPAGVICEIINPDGTMARGNDLKALATKFNLSVLTIQQLTEYRRRTENHIELKAESTIPTDSGTFSIKAFVDLIRKDEIVAMLYKQPGPGCLVRVHSACLTGDVFGSKRCDCRAQLEKSKEEIIKAGSGIIIYLPQEGRGIGLANKISAYALQDGGMDTYEANLKIGQPIDARNYHQASWILKKLGINEIRLITNNPDKVEQLEKYGIKVTERVPCLTNFESHNDFYLKTKKLKSGHLL